MSIQKQLENRSGGKCELCGSEHSLEVYSVPPGSENNAEQSIYACPTCIDQIEHSDKMDPNHWRCLNDSMWSEVPAVQVMAWRMLTRLRHEGWPQDLLDMLYLDEETLEWAQQDAESESGEEQIVHKDCNGVVLQAGDSVVLTKDLQVKGSSLVAKRGAAVRNISLVYDNAEQIEGKVDGQHIVILTKFVKKTK